MSEFAISHMRKGYRHVRNALTVEWLGSKFSLVRHALLQTGACGA